MNPILFEPDSHTTAQLLHHIRDGKHGARDMLIARLEPLLRKFAHGRVPQLLRQQQDTSDIVQVTWLKVLDKLPQIQVQERGDFFAYLRQTLVNALRDALRSEARSPEVRHDVGDITLQSVASVTNVAQDDWLAYEQALAKLPEDFRIAVLMRFEFGMSFVEIGAELDQPPDRVRMRVTRALGLMAGVLT